MHHFLVNVAKLLCYIINTFGTFCYGKLINSNKITAISVIIKETITENKLDHK